MTDLLLADPALRALLRAATRQDEAAVGAFHAWRRGTALNDIGSSAFLVLPSLVALLERHGIADPDLARMRGVGRHVWAANALRLKHLLAALDALGDAGIRPVLLKSAALFARAPAASRRRLPTDHDILVEPARIHDAAAALRKAGFRPKGFTWDDLAGQLLSSVTPGMPIALPGAGDEIDLHWRPLPAITDAGLADGLFAAAEPMTYHGRAVLVPSAAHHLFMALARCEPWDDAECFRRLLEGALLLESPGLRMDWSALEALIRRQGAQAAAAAYLGTLAEDCGRDVPRDLIARLRAGIAGADAAAWRLRHLPPGARSPLAERRILRAAARHAPGEIAAPGLPETLIRQYGQGRCAVAAAWALARRRIGGPSTGAPRFLEGFSFPEAEGRWTETRWALLALPMTPADDGMLTLAGHAFGGQRNDARVLLCAGAGATLHRIPADRETVLRIAARPIPRLGGDALVLLHLPDAVSPEAAGQSRDQRLLGFFVRRAWRG